ncbi:glycosyltransferase family 2 protein [Paraburkholderia silviterrae]|uniref:Glycosyltransferase n=1 Tax=Paraburkholderia silviterrae TaxID=2528715 RepID=A0A4R5LYP8_9BURK|nr:glycosyltransferase family 2 protein [Paraburkholderia silviterrae]TDG17401.1 glycosyltransferase [Paraburkholderia silviterrae]
MAPTLTIVVPCFNEEESLPTTAEKLRTKLADLEAEQLVSGESRILFVDDGSHDQTWAIIDELAKASSAYSGVKLSRNVGHQNALIAGLEHVKTDICISIDADLQDDINAIDDMVRRYRLGSHVVYGVRKDRSSDSPFKRNTAQLFYRAMSRLGVESVENHADFRLLSSEALAALLSMREANVYLRGMVPLVGFPAACVYYDRAARFAGQSKYPLKKMLALAVNGVTSLSVVPLRIIAAFGMIMSFFAGLMSLWVIAAKLFGNAVPGWTSTNLIIVFMGGVQMLALGVVGEYVGCIYLEVKRRPKYFVEKATEA